MGEEKKKRGFFLKSVVWLVVLAGLVLVGGGVAAKFTGDPNC